MSDILDQMQHYPDNTDRHIDHPSQAQPGIYVFPDKLYVVTVLSNPLRWRNRYKNYWLFAKHVRDAGAILYTVELAYGGREFEITESGNPNHIQLRTETELFHKENLIDIGVSRLPLGVKYLAWVDADFTFSRFDWAQETLHQLQHYDVVQMFSSFSDLDSNNKMSGAMNSFMYNYIENNSIIPDDVYGGRFAGAVGGAWAYRTDAYSAIGGMLDTCILGSGDWHMAFGLVGKPDSHVEIRKGGESYIASIKRWQERAKVLNQNIGYVQTHAVHHWHGPKSNRKYVDRADLLFANGYDPLTDVYYDRQEVLSLSKSKPKLRDAIRQYFRARIEDMPSGCK